MHSDRLEADLKLSCHPRSQGLGSTAGGGMLCCAWQSHALSDLMKVLSQVSRRLSPLFSQPPVVPPFLNTVQQGAPCLQQFLTWYK